MPRSTRGADEPMLAVVAAHPTTKLLCEGLPVVKERFVPLFMNCDITMHGFLA